jgi:hypothetical protein
MKIVKLKGGLGNQMFQYAFAKLMEKQTGDCVKLDLSPYAGLSDDSIRVPRIAKFSLSLDNATKDDLESICIFNHLGNSQTFRYRLGIFWKRC